MKKNYFKLLIAVLLVNFGNQILMAQDIAGTTKLDRDPWEGCILVPQEFTERVYIPRRQEVEYKMNNRITPCANFIVTYTGFTPEAQTAFQFAVDIWANLLDSPVPIRVNANFSAITSLGSAGPDGYLINDPSFLPNTAYANALAEKILGEDSDGPTGTSNDINANFSNAANTFYFGLDGNPPVNRIDFVSVVLHELGHGLGMLGFGRVDDNDNPTTGLIKFSQGGTDFVHIWDRFIDGTDIFSDPTPITGFPDPSAQLLGQFTRDKLTCNSPIATGQNGGVPPPTYAPTTWAGGSSYSHWNETTYPNGNPNALMTPFIGNGQAIHDPGPVTLGFMEDMGWSLCQGSLSAPLFSINDVVISPNPFANELTINLSNNLRNDQFSAQIVDINGRLIFESNIENSNGTIVLRDLNTLIPSLYFLTLTSRSSGQRITQKVIKN